MKHTSLVITVVFVAGLGIGYFVRNAGVDVPPKADSHVADLAAIDALHQLDRKVTLSQDPLGLMDIWAEDAVRFNPAGAPAVGKSAIQAENQKNREQLPGFKVMSYASKYKDIQIEDGWACEWGEHEAQFQLSPEAAPIKWAGKGFHVLRRQSDGSWKFEVLIVQP